ncbi:MAG: type II toxin-antitoxin system RelE/ParE family toxin [Caulobacter sp.]|nr:type II toxin-antitoxin system RelE/ParE family toxin [Caulobacter sp.]
MKVVLYRRAVLDLLRLETWLIDKSPTASKKAIALIESSLDSLTEMPQRGYNIAGGIKQLRVPFGKRGYVIRYRIWRDEVQVVRIFHGLEDR